MPFSDTVLLLRCHSDLLSHGPLCLPVPNLPFPPPLLPFGLLFTEVDWNDTSSGPHQPLMFRSYHDSWWKLGLPPIQSHPFHIYDRLYLHYIPKRRRRKVLLASLHRWRNSCPPAWVTEGQRESVAELGQDPRFPNWRPVLNLHLTTIFGVLEENRSSDIQFY